MHVGVFDCDHVVGVGGYLGTRMLAKTIQVRVGLKQRGSTKAGLHRGTGQLHS